MALNENILIRLMADTADYSTKMQAAAATAERLGTSMERPRTAGERLESGFMKVGTAVGALSLAVGVAAVKSFADFDQSMSAVQSNTTASAETMGQLRDAALQAGARTVYSATESADAINELAKAGVSTKDILDGGLDGALDLAASGQMDVADAAELSASALNEFGLSGDQASHVADLLAAGANTAQGSVGDMGEALKMVGTTASQTGMSIEDTTGALTMMSSQGITGSDAGTQLRSALIGLTSASGPAKAEMQQLGISMYDSQGQFVGLANFAGQLQDSLGRLTPEQRANAMGVLFSNAAMSVGNTLYKEGASGVENYTKQVNQQGFAAKQAAELTDNLKGDVEQFGGAIETSLIKIGAGANGPLRSLVQGATSAITMFGDLDPKVQQITVLIGLASGAAAGLHKALGGMADSTSGFKQALSLALDPVQRLGTGLPQIGEGLRLLGDAAISSVGGLSSMTFGMSSARTAGMGLKSIGSGLLSLMGGPWGITLAAAGAALGAFVAHEQQAKDRTQALTDAMQSGTSVSEKLVDELQSGKDIDWGWVQHAHTGFSSLSDMLDATGVSYSTFVKAVQGDSKAMDEASKKLQKYQEAHGLGTSLTDEFTSKVNQEKKALDKAKDSTSKATQAKKELSSGTDKAADSTAKYTVAEDDSAKAAMASADASKILTDHWGANTKGLNDNATALGQEVEALKQYAGFALSAFDADTKWGKAVADADSAVKKNGATLDANTAQGQSNRDALKGLADAAYDSAEAHAKNGEGVDKVNQVMDQGRQKVIAYAESMGMSEADATAFADQAGLSSAEVDKLTTAIDKANAKPLKLNDQASKPLKQVGLTAKALPDGKDIKITGKNKDAMTAIHEVTGAKIDDKHSNLTLNKQQYDTALALANGAKIDTKTGNLMGKDDDYWNKIAESNGWKIDKKTGDISGNDGPFQATKRAVDNATIKGKKVDVGANTTSFWDSINGILGKTFNINIGANKHASGGLIVGPGTGTSDEIPAQLSNGEFVIRAEAVKQYGTDFLNAINWQRYATGGLVRTTQATPVPMPMTPAPNQPEANGVVQAVEHLESMLGPIIAQYAPRLGERDFDRRVRSVVR